jgi:hypothetical protein
MNEERNMGDKEIAEKRITSQIGASMFVAWLLFLGPAGLLVLLGVAYAMVVENLALGIVGGLLLAIPVILAAGWIPVVFFALLRDRTAGVVEPSPDAASETVSVD